SVVRTMFSDDEDAKPDSEESDFLKIFEGLGPGEKNEECEPAKRRLPVVFEEIVEPCEDASDDEFKKLKFYADYDKGFAILPYDKKENPFNLRINGWIQFRHHGFARDVEQWTDNANVTRPVRNRNAFDIERARLYFKGNALDERLSYFYHLDGDTDGRHGVDFFDYWWSWKFNDRFRVQFGKRKVTAGRQWLLGARRTRFIDRPIANDFFRPDRTIGLYALGKIGETGSYEAMIGNGYRTSNLPNNTTDDQFTYAFTQYFDPNGDYGGQIVDFDNNSTPIVRFGHSFVYSPITSEALGQSQAETDFLRLSDGTRLNQTGALSPGVTVSGVNVLFYGVDLGVKWRGWSFNSEVFMRWLDDFESDGPLPVDSLMQRGFYVEGGKFIIPQKLDFNVRYSEINGLVGGGSEYAGGFNWYPLSNNYKLKCSFDVTVLDGSPLNNTASDILVGDNGTLFRTQIQAEF
ncbi:MAG: porin, partial [Planctomycetota bacterium]